MLQVTSRDSDPSLTQTRARCGARGRGWKPGPPASGSGASSKWSEEDGGTQYIYLFFILLRTNSIYFQNEEHPTNTMMWPAAQLATCLDLPPRCARLFLSAFLSLVTIFRSCPPGLGRFVFSAASSLLRCFPATGVSCETVTLSSCYVIYVMMPQPTAYSRSAVCLCKLVSHKLSFSPNL